MADKLYKVVLTFNPNILETYHTIKDFEENYKRFYIKVNALPDGNSVDEAEKNAEIKALEEQRIRVSGLLYTTDGYDLVHFVDEVMLEFNTYASTHKRIYEKSADGNTNNYKKYNDEFTFEDNLTPMWVFTHLSKTYSKLVDYFEEYKLMDEETSLIDFLKLKVVEE